MSAPPSFLSPEEAELSGFWRQWTVCTSTGRLDYAVLPLLARLGLRAGEVVSLELDDIRWCAGEIVIRGKGGCSTICHWSLMQHALTVQRKFRFADGHILEDAYKAARRLFRGRVQLPRTSSDSRGLSPGRVSSFCNTTQVCTTG